MQLNSRSKGVEQPWVSEPPRGRGKAWSEELAATRGPARCHPWGGHRGASGGNGLGGRASTAHKGRLCRGQSAGPTWFLGAARPRSPLPGAGLAPWRPQGSISGPGVPRCLCSPCVPGLAHVPTTWRGPARRHLEAPVRPLPSSEPTLSPPALLACPPGHLTGISEVVPPPGIPISGNETTTHSVHSSRDNRAAVSPSVPTLRAQPLTDPFPLPASPPAHPHRLSAAVRGLTPPGLAWPASAPAQGSPCFPPAIHTSRPHPAEGPSETLPDHRPHSRPTFPDGTRPPWWPLSWLPSSAQPPLPCPTARPFPSPEHQLVHLSPRRPCSARPFVSPGAASRERCSEPPGPLSVLCLAAPHVLADSAPLASAHAVLCQPGPRTVPGLSRRDGERPPEAHVPTCSPAAAGSSCGRPLEPEASEEPVPGPPGPGPTWPCGGGWRGLQGPHRHRWVRGGQAVSVSSGPQQSGHGPESPGEAPLAPVDFVSGIYIWGLFPTGVKC